MKEIIKLILELEDQNIDIYLEDGKLKMDASDGALLDAVLPKVRVHKDKLISFTKEHNMPWRQYFDGKYWQNDLAVKYGIQSIPAAFLLDGNGKIIAKGDSIRGEDLEPAVKKGLGIN